MSESSADNLRLSVLLQEQNQYREEVRMFDSHFFRVMVTYVTGLVAAFGWLGAQIMERSGERAKTMEVTLGTATTQVVQEMAHGPFFFLFASVPLISMLMFLFVARDWASLNERFNLLGPLSNRIARLASRTPEEQAQVLRLDRGFKMPGKKLRSLVESLLVVAWFAIVVLVSIQLLLWLATYADSERRLWWLRTGWLGLGLALLSVLAVWVTFLTRSYKDPDRNAPNVAGGPPMPSQPHPKRVAQAESPAP